MNNTDKNVIVYVSYFIDVSSILKNQVILIFK